MKQEPVELKRLYWSEDKEQIMHILSRVNIKYLCALLREAKYIQRELMESPPYKGLNYWNANERDAFNQAREDTYVGSKVMCKYDGCIFEVSLKTLKEEMNRREEKGEATFDVLYSDRMKKHIWTTCIWKNIKIQGKNEGNKEKSKGKNTGKTIKNKRNEIRVY